MSTVLLIVHLFVTLALIGVVLIQRSEGGGLGVGGAQGMGSFMSGRGTANLLTRTTSILAALFFALSLTLALLNRGTSGVAGGILGSGPEQGQTLPAAPGPSAPPSPAAPGPAAPGPAAPAPAAAKPAPAAPGPSAPAPPAPAPAVPAPARPAAPSVPTN